MLTLTVAQAKQAGKGQQLSGLVGRVKVVFKVKTGESDNGPWSSQGIVLSDLTNPADEVILTLWNHPPYDDSIKGKVATIMPTGTKGGLKGAGTYDKDTPKGTETHYKVDANKSCDITFDDAVGQTQQASRPTQQSQPPQRTSAPAGPPAAPQAGLRAAVQGVSDWETFLAKEKQIMMRCVQAAAKLAKDEEQTVASVTGTGLDSANIVSLAVAIRISGERQGLGVNSPLFAPEKGRASHAPVDPGQDGSGPDDDVAF